MTDGTLETIDGRPALRFERRLPHSVERVWRAVSEPAELSQWFVVPVEWTPAPGERFGPAEQPGEVTDVEPPRLLAWNKDGSRYSFELRADGDACVLTFTHVLADSSDGMSHAAGWDRYLDRLAAQLEGRTYTDDELMDGFDELQERYAAKFGAE